MKATAMSQVLNRTERKSVLRAKELSASEWTRASQEPPPWPCPTLQIGRVWGVFLHKEEKRMKGEKLRYYMSYIPMLVGEDSGKGKPKLILF